MNKVFVSGGSGYIALHTIILLLQKNYFVVTSVKDKDKIVLVKKCLKQNNIDVSRIEFHILDLISDQGWDDALEGCEYVLHMASPVIPGNVEMDLLVKPAVEGMTRCLNAAIKNKANYLAFGAFNLSKTKKIKYRATIKTLKKARKIIKAPIVAIGGIKPNNYKKLLLNKANFLAISGYIWKNKKIKPIEAIKKFK